MLSGDDGMSLTNVASGAVGAVGGLLGGAASWMQANSTNLSLNIASQLFD